MESWLHHDDAFAAQMQRREAVLREHRSEVLALAPSAFAAACELLDLVIHHACEGEGDQVSRSDGKSVSIDRARPLDSLCGLVQEDFCILQKQGDEHVLTGALLCFPASWMLSEKFLQPLSGVHHPIRDYDANIARRVQRLFDGIRPGRPLCRFNALWYEDSELFQPRSMNSRREAIDPGSAGYLRSERQTLVRLPESDAVVFSIHTYVLAAEQVLKRENPA